jgi:hypothetical protein
MRKREEDKQLRNEAKKEMKCCVELVNTLRENLTGDYKWLHSRLKDIVDRTFNNDIRRSGEKVRWQFPEPVIL